MRLQFKNIDIHNFFSIGNANVKLDDNGFVLIKGINNCPSDSASSNGSGKSSIMEAIIFCLTGSTSKGTKDVVNKYTSGGTKVTLEFAIDDKEYKVTRCKDDAKFGTNLFIYINGENKSGKGIRDSEKILQECLPDVTAELLGGVVLLGQGLPQRFTNNTPSGRKEVLEKLSKSDFMIADIKDKLSKRKEQLNQDVNSVDNDIATLNGKKSMLEVNLSKLKSDKALLDNTDIADIESRITLLQNHIVELMKNKEIFELKQSSLQKQVDTALDDYANFSKKLDNNYNHEYNHLEEKYDISNKKILLDDLKSKIKQQENEISKLESIKDICPTCHQKLPDVHKVDTTKLHEELQLMKDRYNVCKQDFDLTNEKLNEEALKLKESLYKDLDEIKVEGQQLRKQLNETIDEVQKYNKEINNNGFEVNKLKLNLDNVQKQSQTIDTNIAECENSLKSIIEEILYNNKKKEDIQAHLEIVSKMMTYATRDFRGFLLSNLIMYIEDRAKIYCGDVFGTDNIKFKLDGNNILIGYLDKSYEALSGGEKQKVDLIVQFAIRDMLSQYLGFSSNILALDEVFDGLDAPSCQRVVDMIAKRFEDVSSIFIITHHDAELSIPYDKQIIIRKNENGVSEIIDD